MTKEQINKNPYPEQRVLICDTDMKKQTTGAKDDSKKTRIYC
jgi:hypothetical protein